MEAKTPCICPYRSTAAVFTSTQQQPLPLSSPVEQAILNLSKVVGTFVEEQKVLNVQTNQKIEAVESSLNRKLDSMHSEVSRLSNKQQQGSERGKFPSQSQQHQKGMREIGSTNDPNVRIDEVKAVVTLRSGKELRPAVPVLANATPTVTDPPEEEQSAKREEVKTSVPTPPPPPPPPHSHRLSEKRKIPLTKLKCWRFYSK